MQLLILGGTTFLGRHLVELALDQGHTVTLFNRGRTNRQLFPTVERLHGDRLTDLAPLRGRRWDAVVDTSGYTPKAVADAADLLAPAVDRYVFISTISVYADFGRLHMDERAPVARLEDPFAAELSNDTYGALKAHCEDAVVDALGDRSLVLRPGLIVGPYDPTDRFTYWPVRWQRGGELLAPAPPDAPVQFIDARDLAQFTLHMLTSGQTGVYNVTGPNVRTTFSDLFAACQAVTGVTPELAWVTPSFLQAHAVTPFVELPLWVPADSPGLLTVDCARAVAAGLQTRPLAATIADTLAWHATRPADTVLRAGLSPARESELLASWRAQ